MKHKLYFAGIILTTASIYIFSCRRAGTYLVKKDELKHADAIVLLMGSIADRILQAVDLFQSGEADKIIIVEGQNDGYAELKARGADMISGARQVGNAAIAMGIPSDRIIILSGGVRSTQQETLIIREYLLNIPDVDTILLVSSAQHMRRAFMIFTSAFRKSSKNICILCSPSSYTEFNAKKWWQSKDDIEVVLNEYVRLASFLLFERRKL